jgi:hypothetical protein
MTIEQVKEHFKDAKEVRCLFNKEIYKYNGNLSFTYGGYVWQDLKLKEEVLLYDSPINKLAEIVSYKEK